MPTPDLFVGPYLPWFHGDWQGSHRVRKLTLAERGLYRELLDLVWREGSVPDDMEEVAHLIGARFSEVRPAWDAARSLLDQTPAGLGCEKLERIRNYASQRNLSKLGTPNRPHNATRQVTPEPTPLKSQVSSLNPTLRERDAPPPVTFLSEQDLRARVLEIGKKFSQLENQPEVHRAFLGWQLIRREAHPDKPAGSKRLAFWFGLVAEFAAVDQEVAVRVLEKATAGAWMKVEREMFTEQLSGGERESSFGYDSAHTARIVAKMNKRDAALEAQTQKETEA